MKHWSQITPGLVILLSSLMINTGTAFAASTNVLCGSPADRFNPTNVTVNTGDQVIWTWVGSLHSTTSGTNGVASGLWNSGLNNAPHTFTNTFNTAGRFAYYCSQHFSLGMTGSVIVVAANLAPSVSITNPAANGVIAAPALLTIGASATDSDGSVTNVQFRVGTTIVTNQTTSPYFATTNLAAGSYTLTAIASDNFGATATNSINITMDAPPAVALTNPATGTVFAAPANVKVGASATDPDGSVTNVQFLVGAGVVTNVTAGPYLATTNNLAAGSYTLSAIAFDNLGIRNTNSISFSIVTPLDVTVTNAAAAAGTNFHFLYGANVGLNYVIQRSTNLTLWISIATNVAASNPVVFIDNHATNNGAFYRVGRMPNP